MAGALVMFLPMMVGIHVTGIAPFNVLSSAAFLETRAGTSLSLLTHFGYGADTDLKAGRRIAGVLWLFIMLVYAPITGWSVFGFEGTSPHAAPGVSLLS